MLEVAAAGCQRRACFGCRAAPQVAVLGGHGVALSEEYVVPAIGTEEGLAAVNYAVRGT